MRLELLPAELHLEIAGFLSEPFDILAFANTSLHFRRLLQSKFYDKVRSFEIDFSLDHNWLRHMTVAPEHIHSRIGWTSFLIPGLIWNFMVEEGIEERKRAERAEKRDANASAAEDATGSLIWKPSTKAEEKHSGAQSHYDSAEDSSTGSESEWDETEDEYEVDIDIRKVPPLTTEKLLEKRQRWEYFIKFVGQEYQTHYPYDPSRVLNEDMLSHLGYLLLQRVVLGDEAWVLSKMFDNNFYAAASVALTGKIEANSHQTQTYIMQPLIEAVTNGCNSVVKVLLENGTDPNLTAVPTGGGRFENENGYSATMMAIHKFILDTQRLGRSDFTKRLEVIEALVNAGGDINCTGAPYSPLLTWFGDEFNLDAILVNSQKLLPRLFELGLNPNPVPASEYWIQNENNELVPPLHMLIELIINPGMTRLGPGEYYDAVLNLFHLFIEAGANTEYIHPATKLTPLMHLVKEYIREERLFDCQPMLQVLAIVLIKAGASVDAKDEHGNSPLMLAATQKQRGLLQILLPGQPERVEKVLCQWGGLSVGAS